jgi:hypothetical protein
VFNLREALLKEHSKSQNQLIVRWIGNDKTRFAELISLFLGNDHRISQRAAWVLSTAAEAHPALVKPHLGKLIANLSKPGHHPSVLRNTLRFLQDMDVPEKYLGRLADSSFSLLLKSDTPIAVKAFAMTVLVNIAKKEPELIREIRLIISDMLPEGSAGIRSRGKKMLKELDRLEKRR